MSTGMSQALSFESSTSRLVALGRRATMPAKMMSEMPLPMPRSVMRSPSHMMKAVPAVRVITVMKVNHSVSLGTTTWSISTPLRPGTVCRPSEASHRAIPMPCTTERTMLP